MSSRRRRISSNPASVSKIEILAMTKSTQSPGTSTRYGSAPSRGVGKPGDRIADRAVGIRSKHEPLVDQAIHGGCDGGRISGSISVPLLQRQPRVAVGNPLRSSHSKRDIAAGEVAGGFGTPGNGAPVQSANAHRLFWIGSFGSSPWTRSLIMSPALPVVTLAYPGVFELDSARMFRVPGAPVAVLASIPTAPHRLSSSR
jgi:hypothetical protein